MSRTTVEIPLPASLRRDHLQVSSFGEGSISTRMRSPDNALSEQWLLSFPGMTLFLAVSMVIHKTSTDLFGKANNTA